MEKLSKKSLIFCIYEILLKYSDAEHPLKQADFVELLKDKYGMICERKSIGSNIAELRKLGVDIAEYPKRGVYLISRVFEPCELLFLIDSVLCNRNIPSSHSSDLIQKLTALGGDHFSNSLSDVKAIENFRKSKSQDFLFNVEMLHEAIKSKLMVSFFLNTYDIDKKLSHTKGDKHKVSPYALLLHNQKYYLLGNLEPYDNITAFRVDRISDINILKTSKARKLSSISGGKDFNVGELDGNLPYLFLDKMKPITLQCAHYMADALIEWFGDFTLIKKNNKHMIVQIKSSEQAMLYWVLQYANSIKVLEPISLRHKVIEKIYAMKALYE